MECPVCKGTGEMHMTYIAKPTTHIAKTLKTARNESGLSLRNVEAITGLTNATISQIENGHIQAPSFQSVIGLCSAYGIKVNDLIEEQLHDHE